MKATALRIEIAAQRVFTQRRRGAQRRRGLRADSRCGGRHTVPLHLRPQEKTTLGSAFSRYGRRGLARSSPGSAAPRGMQLKRPKQRQQHVTRSRGGAEHYSPGRDHRVLQGASRSTAPNKQGLWGPQSAGIGAAAFQSPLRLCGPLRLCVKTRCATEPTHASARDRVASGFQHSESSTCI